VQVRLELADDRDLADEGTAEEKAVERDLARLCPEDPGGLVEEKRVEM